MLRGLNQFKWRWREWGSFADAVRRVDSAVQVVVRRHSCVEPALNQESYDSRACSDGGGAEDLARGAPGDRRLGLGCITVPDLVFGAGTLAALWASPFSLKWITTATEDFGPRNCATATLGRRGQAELVRYDRHLSCLR